MELELQKIIKENITKQEKSFGKTIGTILDQGADYLLKALPIQENIKDVLRDVKKCLKNKQFDKLLQTVVQSSIREGCEFLGITKKEVKNFEEMKNISYRGGLREGLLSSIDIVTSKYTKNNLLSDEIVRYVGELKEFVTSKSFMQKLEKQTVKLDERLNSTNQAFEKWVNCYEKQDVDGLNKAISHIAENQSLLSKERIDQYKTLKNITELASRNNGRLTEVQLEICNTI